MSTLTYRMYALWRVQLFAMFAVFAIVAVAGAVSTGGPPLWIMGLWILAAGWNAYWFLFRVAYRLDVADDKLRWRTPLRSGVVLLSDLVEMRPHRLGSSIEVIEVRNGSKILVLVRKGFVDFAADLQAAAPHVRARVGTLAKIGDRFPGPRGYRRGQ